MSTPPVISANTARMRRTVALSCLCFDNVPLSSRGLSINPDGIRHESSQFHTRPLSLIAKHPELVEPIQQRVPNSIGCRLQLRARDRRLAEAGRVEWYFPPLVPNASRYGWSMKILARLPATARNASADSEG